MLFLKAGRRYFLLECLKVDIPIKLYKEVFNVIFFYLTQNQDVMQTTLASIRDWS